jgi:hypothetical protein
MLPTNTAKKSSTRDRPRRRRYSPLELEGERHQPGDEGQEIDEVVAEGRRALGNRNQQVQRGVEAKRISGEEGAHAEERVRHDVQGNQQAVVALQHAGELSNWRVSLTMAVI